MLLRQIQKLLDLSWTRQGGLKRVNTHFMTFRVGLAKNLCITRYFLAENQNWICNRTPFCLRVFAGASLSRDVLCLKQQGFARNSAAEASPCPWNNYKTRHGRWHPLSWPKNAAAISQQNIQQNKKELFNIDPLSRVLKGHTIYSWEHERNKMRITIKNWKKVAEEAENNWSHWKILKVAENSWKKLEMAKKIFKFAHFARFPTFWDFLRGCGGASEFSPKSRSLDAVGLERHFVGKNSPLQKPKGVFLMTLSISI